MGKKRAVVLLSGGLDSATVLAITKKEDYEIFALTFNYGQRHKNELESAIRIAKYYKIKKHLILNIELDKIGGSSLTDKNIELKEREFDDFKNDIPNTYVPSRNTIFLSFALSYAEVIKADSIFIGANSIDYSGYPDCRPKFIEAFQKVSEYGTKIGIEGKPIKIVTPIIKSTKSEIIKKGCLLGVPFELTWSCYRGLKKACGTCDSCKLRLKGFKDANLIDPIRYF